MPMITNRMLIKDLATFSSLLLTLSIVAVSVISRMEIAVMSIVQAVVNGKKTITRY